MSSDDIEPLPEREPSLYPLRDPGPVPIPEEVERAEMRSVLLRHRLVNQVCRACGNPPDHTGYCWAGRVAYERLASGWNRKE
ncbi:hypothetical protein Pen02_70440 [Plantactinospora endophytica]|uniref:Uncharacterized protein n=1 Tax=Plantactinospora endophytica TaxID=673535 RepID=A0ABQ4EBJ9_9ACTN|nr:hypothetical protein Pen02_70440 [Plantactinospora endophytica]